MDEPRRNESTQLIRRRKLVRAITGMGAGRGQQRDGGRMGVKLLSYAVCALMWEIETMFEIARTAIMVTA